MKFLVLGSMNIDSTFSVSHIVHEGETITSCSRKQSPGGKGANQAAALAKAGAKVYFAGKFGEDGRFILELLSSYGADTSLSVLYEGNTGSAFIQVDNDGQNAIVIDAGGNRKWTEDEIVSIFSHFEKGDVIVLQNEINLLGFIIEKAKEKGLIIVLNPSPYDEIIDSLPLNKVDYFFLNEIEAEALTNKKDYTEMIEAFKIKFPNSNLILTCGKNGSYASVDGNTVYQKIIDYPVKDTTGAGDTFTGFFLSAFFSSSLQQALFIASKASGIAVSREGAMISMPTLDEINM